MANNTSLPSDVKPYVGPVPFERKDQALFFGRQHEVEELFSLLTAHPVVLLYSQSGAGKTSLLNAGLIPVLEEARFQVIGSARVRGQLPADLDYKQINPYAYNALKSLPQLRLNLSASSTPLSNLMYTNCCRPTPTAN